MTLRLTPEILERTYARLCVTPPFNKWKLPDANDVEFHVTRHRDRAGDCVDAGHAWVIRVSEVFHDSLATVDVTMAHEMAHIKQRRSKPGEREHGRYFQSLAKRICKVHGWSEKTF